MSIEPEPVRWLDPSSEIPEELRAALTDAQSDQPSPEVLARIQAGVLAKIAFAGKLGLFIKFFIGLTVAGVVALQYWPRPLPPEPPPVAAPAALPEPTLVPHEEPPPPASVVSEPLAPPPPPPDPKPRPRPSRSAPSVPAEIDLLEASQAALPHDPAEALRLTQLSERHYPEGDFVPEREALAIQALLRLGRRDEAESRHVRLRQRYPNAAVSRRLEELLRPPN